MFDKCKCSKKSVLRKGMRLKFTHKLDRSKLNNISTEQILKKDHFNQIHVMCEQALVFSIHFFHEFRDKLGTY